MLTRAAEVATVFFNSHPKLSPLNYDHVSLQLVVLADAPGRLSGFGAG
jgi:hypothetical protein